LLRAADGALYGCGDNQFGALGSDRPRVVPSPLRLATGTRAFPLAVSGANGAYTADGCSVRIAGDNGEGLVAPGAASAATPFTVRANLSVCGSRPAVPLATVVSESPRGGESGCWAPRVLEDAAASPRFASLHRAMLVAEAVLARNAAFLAPPEPARMRAALSAGPEIGTGASLHVKVVPERKGDGTRLWGSGCRVIPQIDRIGGAIAQVSVFFNRDARGQLISPTGQAPSLTGQVGPYPEYDGWVVITKDGRLPWIAETLADKLDQEAVRRRQALSEWTRTRADMKTMDPAAVQRTYEALKATDPAGAENFLATARAQAEELTRQRDQVHPARTALLEQQVRDLEDYRASFTAEQLRAPAVWGDPTGEGKRLLDAEVAAARRLPAEAQQEIDGWTRERRTLETQARTEATSDPAGAARRRAHAADLTRQARAVQQSHLERAAIRIEAATRQYELKNLQPGVAERAITVKPDPSFPDRGAPDRVQIIIVSFSRDPDARQTARRAWQQQVKETFDFAALAALLD
jgi:hypothetical protein